MLGFTDAFWGGFSYKIVANMSVLFLCAMKELSVNAQRLFFQEEQEDPGRDWGGRRLWHPLLGCFLQASAFVSPAILSLFDPLSTYHSESSHTHEDYFEQIWWEQNTGQEVTVGTIRDAPLSLPFLKHCRIKSVWFCLRSFFFFNSVNLIPWIIFLWCFESNFEFSRCIS